MVWLSVKGLADDEEGARIARTVPTRPWSLSVTESQLNPQTAHHGIVEAQGALEIANADKDMVKHVYSSGDLDKRFSRPVSAGCRPMRSAEAGPSRDIRHSGWQPSVPKREAAVQAICSESALSEKFFGSLDMPADQMAIGYRVDLWRRCLKVCCAS
jgi:hypothetical protein